MGTLSHFPSAPVTILSDPRLQLPRLDVHRGQCVRPFTLSRLSPRLGCVEAFLHAADPDLGCLKAELQ